MKLTTKGTYALVAVLDIINNSKGKPVRLEDISKRQGISLHYLQQLVRRLRKNNIIRVIKGPGGGCVLAKKSNTISVKDVLFAAGEKKNVVKSINNKSGTSEKETVESYFTGITNNTLDILEDSTVDNLVQGAIL